MHEYDQHSDALTLWSEFPLWSDRPLSKSDSSSHSVASQAVYCSPTKGSLTTRPHSSGTDLVTTRSRGRLLVARASSKLVRQSHALVFSAGNIGRFVDGLFAGLSFLKRILHFVWR